MPPISPAVAKRRLDALRACAANPQGLRPGAYPSVMPVLESQGLVTKRIRPQGGRAAYWFLTEQGREIVKEIGVDQARGS
jgi:hypothetical protein